ncbi:LmeA family phospholipid-binding protein [Williamsia deligens]|uniref:LmeA family phospholipid-binding protein n=1 Tax=Williamsia deligens TaxID=321325 RepID=A0ABW3GBG4_9NOCA|nr:LmeA family phospholipid-binding protein [Williamsia deligens]MCP2193095.1 Protein of unknown function (DUF2993) [Williamsia deligens]
MTERDEPSQQGARSDPGTERIPQQQPPPQAWSQTRPFESGSDPYSGAQPQVDPQYTQPAADPATQARRPRRRRGVIAGVSVLVVLLVLVIAGVGSELYLRNATKDCLEQSFTTATGSSATVSLSKKPMLLQYVTKEVPYVQIDANGDNGQAIELHGRADNITARSDGSTLGSLDATGSVPFTRIVELSKQGAQQSQSQDQSGTGQSGESSGLGGLFGGFTVNSVTGNEASGTMSIDATVTVAIFPIPVSTEIKPVVTDGKLTFQVVKASALVFGVPAGFAQTIVDGVTKSLFPPLFDDLTFQKLTVTSQGVDFAVRGSDVPLNAQSLGSTQQDTGSSQNTCSVL